MGALLETASLLRLPPCPFHIFLCHSLNPSDQQHCYNAAGQEFSLVVHKFIEIQIKGSPGAYGHGGSTGRFLSHPRLQVLLRTASDGAAWYSSFFGGKPKHSLQREGSAPQGHRGGFCPTPRSFQNCGLALASPAWLQPAVAGFFPK